MAVFVHLASHRDIASIRRGGIRPARLWKGDGHIYAMPVTRNFQIAHQWLRELKRNGSGTIMGVYFRIPDETRVEIGHYNSLHVEMTAAEAIGLVMAAEQRDPVASRAADEASKAVRDQKRLPISPEGFEVRIPGPIPPSAITRIKKLPQLVGWRYRPGANGTRPCACICCERGVWGIRRLEARFEADEIAGRPSRITLFGRSEASFDRVERGKQRRNDR